jgi:G protein-coupled receptor GPR1
MQVYTPIVDPHDPRYGLNPYRYYVNTVLLVLPVILASLAFINPEGGYANGVSVCWLPIRPIWYQLALSWLPRYIIFLIVSVLSIAVYAHVGHQFRSFRNAWSSHLKLIPDKQSIPPVSLPSEPDRPKKVSFSQGPPTIWDGSRRRTRRDERRLSLPDASLLSPTASETAKITRFASNRRHTEDMGYTSNEQTLSSIPLETHEDVQYVKALWQNTPDVQASSEGRRESLVTNGTVWSTASDRPTQNIPILPSIICSNDQLIQPVHGPSSPDLERGLSESATQNLVEARRQTMIKQMRVNFVYPIVYITLWTTPFVLHCLQYSEKYANNPPPVLIAMSTLCIPSMGFANAVCFLIREKPWLEVGLWPEWVLQKFQNSNGGATKDLVGIKPGHSSSVSMDVSIIGTSLSSRSSSFNSRAAQLSQQDKMSAEYPNSLPIGYARPWSAKNKALERLALERQDRRRQMQIILRGSEGIEDASTTESTKTPLVYRTSGSEAKRYWWEETDQSSSTRPFSNEPQQQDDKENIGSLVHETDLNAS